MLMKLPDEPALIVRGGGGVTTCANAGPTRPKARKVVEKRMVEWSMEA
jgi:hypothetical protein